MTSSEQSRVAVEFCGEWHEVPRDRPFGIGRDADLEVDANLFLHRRLRWRSAVSTTCGCSPTSAHAWP